MKVLIRQERPDDHELVEHVVKAAFEKAEFSDQKEHFLVNRLRRSDAFVPELSLVATDLDSKRILGHILFTKVTIIQNGLPSPLLALALAPISVHPDYQRQGVGKQLIEKGHDIAKELGFGAIIVLGHKDYYPKFGYEMTRRHGIILPFDAPDENCLCLELKPGALASGGTVNYAKEFNE